MYVFWRGYRFIDKPMFIYLSVTYQLEDCNNKFINKNIMSTLCSSQFHINHKTII